MDHSLLQEIFGILFLFGILVVPKILQRYLVPAPVTCFFFGFLAILYLPELQQNQTVLLLATLGISSLFLFAGLEVRLEDLRSGQWPILGYLAIHIMMLAATAWGLISWAELSWQAATLTALALLTPSTGFILDSLRHWGTDEHEEFWITVKAISSEVLALLLLIVVLQASSPLRLLVSTSVLTLIIIGLPMLFLLFGRIVLPYAPGSEFSFLVLMGFIAAYITKQLGVYYLVGAFLAGFLAQLLRRRMPTLVNEEILHAVRLFASFFIPFYFFASGMRVPPEALCWESLALGLAAGAVFIPLRIGMVWVQRRPIFDEHWRHRLRISISLTPTLIFTLVLANILRQQYQLSDPLYGALLVYTLINTSIPSFILPRPVDFDPAATLMGPHGKD
jgi:Kef-type K+ transport system membrane component KefB